ncbi:MAG: PIN domain-containing protein [Actinomycetota bacterium]
MVVDTSVWIDVINELETREASRCVELLEDGAPVALTDVVFAEVLQGFEQSERRVWLNCVYERSRCSDWGPWTTSA